MVYGNFMMIFIGQRAMSSGYFAFSQSSLTSRVQFRFDKKKIYFLALSTHLIKFPFLSPPFSLFFSLIFLFLFYLPHPYLPHSLPSFFLPHSLPPFPPSSLSHSLFSLFLPSSLLSLPHPQSFPSFLSSSPLPPSFPLSYPFSLSLPFPVILPFGRSCQEFAEVLHVVGDSYDHGLIDANL